MASITPLFTLPAFWIVLFCVTVALALLALRLRLPWWPAFLSRFLLTGMALLALFSVQMGLSNHPSTLQREVMVVDQSDSLAEETRQQALAQALRWQAQTDSIPNAGANGATNGATNGAEMPNRSIIVFGSEALPLLEQNDPAVSALPQVDGRASNLSAALALAGNILGSSAGKILLASDGLAAQPSDVRAAASQLSRLGHTLDVIPLQPRPMENDLAVGSLIAPRNLWTGTPVDLVVPVMGAENITLQPQQLRLRINGRDSELRANPAQDMFASVGVTYYHFQIPTLPEGMVTLEVSANPGDAGEGDPLLDNNTAYSVVQVFPPPRVLFVTGSAESAAVNRFQQALTQRQIQIDIIPPEELTTDLATLQQYRVIFIDNILANQISGEQMTALDLFVSRLAGGLVFLGGRNSYTSGGYQGTPLEAMLPVRLEPPPRTQRAPMVFQLILDRSSSMSAGEREDGVGLIGLAREAAMRSIETLQPEDYLGLLSFSDNPRWNVPLRPLGGPDGIEQAMTAVSRLSAMGTTSMYEAMQETARELAALPPDAPRSRHILLLSDGKSSDGSDEEFRSLAEAIHAQGITISAIALGEGADADGLAEIVEAGKGRFYVVEKASTLPRIMVSESKAARSENIQTGATSLKIGEAGHPVLSGIDLSQLPVLNGYNALQSRADEGAEDILVSASFGDPLMSAWQYGLGRVAAWTGDLGEEWAANGQPETEGAFWSQVVRYMLVDPAQSPAQASIQVAPTALLVEAAVYSTAGDAVNMADVRFTYSDAQGSAVTYSLMQKSAGVYQAELPRPPLGAYRAVLIYSGEGIAQIEVPVPFAVNAPLEWQPENPARGVENLNQWASAAGGKITTLQAENAPLPQQRSPADEAWWRLLLALAILWPLEIAIRRRWLPWME